MDKELTGDEAKLAWAQGKRVDARNPHSAEWKPMVPLGGGKGHYTPYAFVEESLPFKFRLAPERPEKKWRPWKPEEVPVGAMIRAKGLKWRGLILSSSAIGEIHCMTGFVDAEYALNNHEHSTDGGKTWMPCGASTLV